MKRVLGVAMLMLLACGSGVDAPSSGPDSPADQESKPAADVSKTLKDHFVWGNESQPSRDWDGDAAECRTRAREDSTDLEEPHPLAMVAFFMGCMEEMGWEAKRKNR